MAIRESDLEFELSFTQAVAEVIGSPRALCVSLLAKAGEWDQLLDLQCDHVNYRDAGNFADDYLITELLQKSQLLPTGRDTSAVALQSFYDAEARNASTNHRFSITDAVDHPVWWWRCEKYLRRVLGPLTVQALTRIEKLAKHGPGSVVGLKKQSGIVPSMKYDMRPTCTEELVLFASALPESWVDYHSIGPGVDVVPGNKFFTVPKNARTDRGCAEGPELNIWYQMGVGRYIADRLRYFDVDLQDQGLNRFLASKAHEWQLATIDLSNASDLMAHVPVMMLLDDRWGALIDLLREKSTTVPVNGKQSKSVALEKLCAMGNGFTFALETALFLAVVRAIVPVAEHCFTAAYGDDLIVPQRYAVQVCEALEYLGFKVNLKKTCLAGMFFESCGTDWFNGQNVRPFYLRKAPPKPLFGQSIEGEDVSLPPGIPYQVLAGNALRLWARRRAQIDSIDGCDGRFRNLWRRLVTSADSIWRLAVPESFGDSGFVTSYGEAGDPMFRVKPAPILLMKEDSEGIVRFKGLIVNGWEGFFVKHTVLTQVKIDRKTYGVVLSHLAGLPDKPSRYLFPEEQCVASYGQEPVRGLFGAPVAKWALVTEWPMGLDWVDLNRSDSV